MAFLGDALEAIQLNNVDALQKFITDNPSLLTWKNEHGSTLIHEATKYSRAFAIELLVKAGSQHIDTFGKTGWTPMYTSTSFGDVSIVELLFRLGSQAIDTPNDWGRTPLHAAAHRGSQNMIETLVRLGSQTINLQAQNRISPLYLAAAKEHYSSVSCLLALGADRTDVRTFGVSLEMLTFIKKGVDEDHSAEVRYRVYFSESLTSRLLIELDRSKMLCYNKAIQNV